MIATKQLDLAGFRDSIYGDGSDGDVTISSNTSLTEPKYYNNLTINTGITLSTEGCPVYVKGTLTLNGSISNNGNMAIGATRGFNSNTVPADGNRYIFNPGAEGGNGKVGITGSNNNGTGYSRSLGGLGGASGEYDTTGKGTGGTSTPVKSYPRDIFSALRLCDSDGVPYSGGTGGGSSDGYNNTGGAGINSGGGGGGGGVLAVYAANLSVSATGTIRAVGGMGWGSSSSLYVTGGGGGGGGAVILVYGKSIGVTAPESVINVSGGAGGPGLSGGAANGSAGSSGNAFIFITG